MKWKEQYKNNWKQIVLFAVLIVTAGIVICQKGLIANNRRWLFLLGIVVFGMIYVAIPWESVQRWIDRRWYFSLDVNRWLSRILLLVSPVVSFYLVQVYGGFTDKEFLKLLFSLRGGCNLLLYASMGYVFYLICNRAKYTPLLLILISSIYGLANYFVSVFRDSPILAADLGSIGTAMDVAEGYEYYLDSASFKAVILTVVFCCVILRQKSYRWLKWKKRLVVLAGAVLLYMSLSAQIFSGDYFKKNNISLNVWNPSANYVSNGSLVSLAISYSYYHVERPAGYSVEAVEKLAEKYPSDPAKAQVAEQQLSNLIVVMNEAFSDLSVLGNLETSEEVMPFTGSLEEDTVKGNLYVSVRSSQTPNSEFEFLTGCSLGLLPYRSIPYNSYVKCELPTLTTTLKALGYGRNLAFHPGMPDAWNRDNVYPLLGFEEFYAYGDIEADLEESDIVHGYPSDAFGYQYLIEEYEEFRQSSQEPFYSFFVTIQNHSGYETNLVDVEISLENAEEWGKGTEQYLNLVKLSDDALKGLVEHFAEVEEPTVILLFGDHQPGISPKKSARTYTSDISLYEVPYIIWANYDIREEQADMSANYLSSYLLKVMGTNMTGYNKFLLDLQKSVPIITANGYIGDDGVLYDWEQESSYEDVINEYRMVQYNNLFDTDNRAEEFFYLQ